MTLDAESLFRNSKANGWFCSSIRRTTPLA